MVHAGCRRHESGKNPHQLSFNSQRITCKWDIRTDCFANWAMSAESKWTLVLDVFIRNWTVFVAEEQQQSNDDAQAEADGQKNPVSRKSYSHPHDNDRGND